jgi:hypothetical protein
LLGGHSRAKLGTRKQGGKMKVYIPTDTTFRLKDLKMKENSQGISWTAKVMKEDKAIGFVFDDGANMIPRYHFDNRDMFEEFENWASVNGDPDWVDVDLAAAGLYALSNLHAVEEEGYINE